VRGARSGQADDDLTRQVLGHPHSDSFAQQKLEKRDRIRVLKDLLANRGGHHRGAKRLEHVANKEAEPEHGARRTAAFMLYTACDLMCIAHLICACFQDFKDLRCPALRQLVLMHTTPAVLSAVLAACGDSLQFLHVGGDRFAHCSRSRGASHAATNAAMCGSCCLSLLSSFVSGCTVVSFTVLCSEGHDLGLVVLNAQS